MTIRIATEEDLCSIAKIGLYNWKDTYKDILPDKFLESVTLDSRMEYYRTYLNKGLLVAVLNGFVVGFSAYKPDSNIENCTYLDSLHISITARGKGIGTSLINAVKKIAKENNSSKMSVSVMVGNETAERLYKKLGAEHLEYFVDNNFFNGVSVKSEKLIWQL